MILFAPFSSRDRVESNVVRGSLVLVGRGSGVEDQTAAVWLAGSVSCLGVSP